MKELSPESSGSQVSCCGIEVYLMVMRAVFENTLAGGSHFSMAQQVSGRGDPEFDVLLNPP